MGAADSKLLNRGRVLQLAGLQQEFQGQPSSAGPQSGAEEENVFIQSDDKYWEMYWQEPQSAEDVFGLLSALEIKTIRDSNKTNFLNLVRIVATKLISIAKTAGFPNTKAQTRQLLNCVRVLTRVLPFAFEKPELKKDLDHLFWNLNYNSVDYSTKRGGAESDPEDHQYDQGSTHSTVGYFSSDSGLDSSLSSSSLKVNINQQIRKSPSSTQVNISTARLVNSLGHELVNTLVDLLFTREFTLEKSETPVVKGTDFKIWEVGISSNGKYSDPNPELDSNRLEILRLLLVLNSQCLYTKPKDVVAQGSRFTTVLVSATPRLKFLTLVCSLLNLVCRSCRSEADDNGLNYKQKQFSKLAKLRTQYITFSLQLLTVMLVYPIPSHDIQFLYDLNIMDPHDKPHNLVRSYLGRLQKENELSFIYSSLFNLLKTPIETAAEDEFNPFSILRNNSLAKIASNGQRMNSSSSLTSPTLSSSPSTNQSSSNGSVSHASSGSFPTISPWSTEIIILLWELIQCNKNFKLFVYSKKSPELLITLFYYIRFYKNSELWNSNLIRVISYLFLYLISNEVVLNNLLLQFNSTYYNKLPQFFKVNVSNQVNNLTYRDFLIIQISNIIINDEFDPVINQNCFEYLYNLIPIKNSNTDQMKMNNKASRVILSYHSCLSLMNIISKFNKSPEFFSDEIKLDLLALVIRSITNAVCRYHKESRTLIYVLTKHENILLSLLNNIKSFKNDNLSSIKEEGEEEGGDGDAKNGQKGHVVANDNESISSIDSYEGENTTFYHTGGDVDNDPENEEDSALAALNQQYEFESSLRPKLPIGMSSNAKGKQPIDAPLIKTWAGSQALKTLIKIIQIVKSEIPNIQSLPKSELMEVLIKIENLHYDITPFTNSQYLPTTQFERLKFTWSSSSLGWYESILWSVIYQSNVTASKEASSSNGFTWFNKTNSTLKEVASEWGFSWGRSNSNPNVNNSDPLLNYQFDNSILQLNIWNGSVVKLFRFQTISNNDKPLVDVNNLMRKLRFNSTSSLTTIDSNNSANGNGNGNMNNKRNSISTINSPNQLTPINSRQSFQTPMNSISRQNSFIG